MAEGEEVEAAVNRPHLPGSQAEGAEAPHPRSDSIRTYSYFFLSFLDGSSSPELSTSPSSSSAPSSA